MDMDKSSASDLTLLYKGSSKSTDCDDEGNESSGDTHSER
jgi:hypothetical protein